MSAARWAARAAPRMRRSQAILAFLENELGLQAVARGDYAGAIARFESAIDLDAGVVPAYLNLGDVHARDDRDGASRERLGAGDRQRARPRAIWRSIVCLSLTRGWARRSASRNSAGSSLPATRKTGARGSRSPGISRHADDPSGALELLFEALVHNPHALTLHQAIWQVLSRLDFERALVQRYVELTRARGLLHGSAHLHALPLPQHRAALAVSALPRMEHVRGGPDRAGKRTRRARRLGSECQTRCIGRPTTQQSKTPLMPRGGSRIGHARFADS